MTDDPGPNAQIPESPAHGASPYATGGGGVTLERRAAVLYLSRLLTGGTGVGLRGRRVERVAFQQAPAHRVDDLVISARRDDETGSVELEVAVRRAPAFTTSEQSTEQLVGDLLAALRTSSDTGVERRVAICVAGPQRAAQQVSQLADLAQQQATASGFFTLVGTPGRFSQGFRDRLAHLTDLVAANLSPTDVETSHGAAQGATWELLNHLEILMPRLEAPDENDWSELLNQLQPWAREPTVAATTALRDRLESLAATYAPAAADVDLATLRRDAHDVLHFERRRREAAWAELRRLDADARSAVRNTLGPSPGANPLCLPRPGPTSEVRGELHTDGPVLVSGESGVGKSALVVGELAEAAAGDPATYDFVCLNLRLLPPTITEMRDILGAPLEELLAEMSAPTRLLVLDAADVMIERDDQLLAPLLRAARAADLTPWVVCATEGLAAIRTVIQEAAGPVREVTIGGLEDAELEEVANAFPQLRRLVDDPRAKELLRRPAITDLFVRSGSEELPFSEADAFDIVWDKLIRNDQRTTRGLPDAREQVMRSLASQELRHSDPLTTYAGLDPAAVSGLQHDALLRPPDRWRPLPSFAHELLRTYAVTRVLLSVDDLIEELIACDAPRWALPAVRLAVQVMLTEPDTPQAPLAGRFARIQTAIDRLPESGHGQRWADLPTEAVLTLPNAGEILADAWPTLVDGDATGLQRLLRAVQQRHTHAGMIDRLIAEPVVALLLEHGWPSALGEQVDKLLREWLRGLVVTGEPAGHRLRIALREQLVARVAAGDERLAEMRREEAARRAARTPEQVAEDEARAHQLRDMMALSRGGRRRRRRERELPGELTDEALLEQLALLGADLGEEGASLLQRVAAESPHDLEAAVEGLLTGHSLTSYDTALLVDLVEAYYIDERDADYGYGGLGDDGIRHHRHFGWPVPLSAAYRGPFLALLRVNLPAGVACLNRLLNHAAHARVKVLRNLSWGDPPEPEDRYAVDLEITGERRRYVGDGHVWLWYRGTGVGPYPCMSALQALELVCDEYSKAGVPLTVLVRLLLNGCENLAMPALVVGMLVRHLEDAGSELDPFLAEPAIWHLEFARTVQEQSGLAAQTEGIVAPERRTWNLRDVSARLALTADGDRAEALRAVGRRLVTRAAELEGRPADGEPLSDELAAVRSWAGSLDPDSYQVTETEQGIVVEQVVEEDVVARLAPSNADLARGNNATSLLFRYPDRFDHIAEQSTVTLDDLLADLATARDLADNPPTAGVGGPYDAPAAVAAAALEARFRDGLDVPEDDLVWAAELLVGVLNALADEGAAEDDYSVFGRGADRAAARAVPLLSLPTAHDLRDRLAAEDVTADAITRAIAWVVEHGANETRLFLVRGFDPLWHTPCDETSCMCHHAAALATIEDTARDSLIGPWDPAQQRNSRLHIDGPVAPRLQEVEHELVYVPQISATIRGAAAAAVSTACCHRDAAALLAATLIAHRRGMRASKHGYHHSDNDAAAAARAILDVAGTGDTSLLFAHLDDYTDDPRLLGEFLRALVAAGEETQTRAAAARDVWPAVLDHVVGLVASGACPTHDYHYGQAPLAAVIPTPSYESGYLHREYEADPIMWADPSALAPQIERWLPHAAGHPEPLDRLAQILHRLSAERQAEVGLPWMEQLVMADPEEIANRSFLLPEWLEGIQPYAASQASRKAWHRIVDALTVAGDDRIAGLAD